MNRLLGTIAAVLLALTASADAEIVEYYIALDNAANVPTWSYFSPRANPNQGRLTFLYAHADGDPSEYHFHEIGYYSYLNPSNPTVVNRSYYSFLSDGVLYSDLPGFTIPEQFGDFGIAPGPLKLLPGEGIYAGKLATRAIAGEEYTDLEIRSANELAGFGPGTPEHHLLHNLDGFGEDWTGSLAGSVLALELVDKTPGLHIGSPDALDILSTPGDRFTIASDGSSFAFTPVLWTDASAPPGTYSATFKLVDVRTGGTPLGESGEFVINVRPVPEPGSLMLLGLGLAGLIARPAARRRASGVPRPVAEEGRSW